MDFDELSSNNNSSYGSLSKSFEKENVDPEADIVVTEIEDNFEHAVKQMNREYESPVSRLFALDGLGNIPKVRRFLGFSD